MADRVTLAECDRMNAQSIDRLTTKILGRKACVFRGVLARMNVAGSTGDVIRSMTPRDHIRQYPLFLYGVGGEHR